MRKNIIIVISLLTAGYFISYSIYFNSLKNKNTSNFLFSNAKKYKIALIKIYGPIDDTTHILELLNLFSNMKEVKAIVLRINSPGGGVGASQEIYRQIIKIRKKGIKVIAHIGDVGASGAYYIASACDEIIANPGSITGSIGVIVNYVNAKKLLDKVGIEFITVKSGKYKDIGSFSKESTQNDKKILKKVIRDVLDQFVNDIANARLDKFASILKIKIKDKDKKLRVVKKYIKKRIADGRIITGKEAKELGLIDELGNIDDAIEMAAKMIGIKGRPLVLSERPKRTIFPFLNSKLQNLKFSNIIDNDWIILKYIMGNSYR